VILNPQGQLLSIQNVSAKWNKRGYFGLPAITTVNDTTYITYYHTPYLYGRRYLSDGQPVDSQSVKLFQSEDFESIGKLIWYPATNQVICHWTDLICENDLIHFTLPRLTDNGISLFSFKTDLSIISQPASLNGQCQIAVETPARWQSFSIIRASSIGGNALTAWIDEREGNTRVYGNFFDIGIVTGIEHEEDRMIIPQDFSIFQNYPNPFNPSTNIEFALPKSAFVTLKVYNLLGEEVATLVAEQREAGIHRFNWDARGLASGVYLYRLEAGKFVAVKKLILMR
jgi:hypothetical protein